MPRMSNIITALLLTRSQRKGISSNEGKNEFRTLGIVSPTMTQKATMPPKALHVVNTLLSDCGTVNIQ